MSEKPLPFVITDRRKFSATGEPRPDADPSPEKHRDFVPAADTPQAAAPTPVAAPEEASSASNSELTQFPDQDSDLPPAPTEEQMEQSRIAFQATADRLDIAVRAANPGAEHPPALSFEGIVQSVYMQAILQLGGGTQEGQQPQVDILGARQSIDMLAILHEKTGGNLSKPEQTLLSSAIFELRLAFLEITQALARSAQQRASSPAGPGGPAGSGGSAGPMGGGAPSSPGSRPGPSLIR